jgi:uncharacterized protein
MKPRQSVMSIETFDKHYKSLPDIMKLYNQERFTTTLFGGEPLMNWKLIQYILPLVSRNSLNDGITMPTNGLLLTADKWELLQKYNVNISLSFDGLWNKTNRVDKEGKSTFDRYMDLFAWGQTPGAHPIKNCKVMIPPHRIYTLAENFKWFVEVAQISNPDFSLVRDNVWDHSDVKQFEIEIKELADLTIDYILAGCKHLPGIFRLYMLDTIAGEKYGKRPFGCFAGCHGAGFMPDSNVYPCARYGSNRRHKLATSTSKGAVYEDPTWQKYTKFVTNPRTFLECQDCELYKYCNAGCTFSQLGVFSERAHPIENVCKIMKMSYKQAYRIMDKLKENTTFQDMMREMTKNLI